MQTAIENAIWLGRATMLAIGVGVMLALVLGLSTVALAAVPGDPFKLGRTNTVNAMSSLVGSVAGTSLKVDNNSAASGATALDLQVQPTKDPMKVNSSAKVDNLNSDELDGKNSTEFASATNGKAKDAYNADFATFAGDTQNAQAADNADKLDGKDSTDFVNSAFGTAPNANNLDGKDSTRFFSGETYTKDGAGVSAPEGTFGTASATCDPGDTALSGGYSFGTVEGIVGFERIDGDKYTIGFEGGNAGRAFVTCADFPPLR